MMNSESLPLMTQTIANQASIYNSQYRNPNTTKSTLTLEQQYQNLAQQMIPNQQLQSDPYTDFKNIINSCSDMTREKILADPRFQNIYSACEEVLKQVLYAKVIPEVLADQNGRIVFEQLCATTKSLKDELVQRDIQKERQLEILMQDEVVLRRLQELQNAPQQPQVQHHTQHPPQTQQHNQTAPQPSQGTPKQPNQQVPQKQNNYNKNNNQQKSQSSGGVD